MLVFGFHHPLSRIFNLDTRSLSKKKAIVNLYIRLDDPQGVSVRVNVRLSKLVSEV